MDAKKIADRLESAKMEEMSARVAESVLPSGEDTDLWSAMRGQEADDGVREDVTAGNREAGYGTIETAQKIIRGVNANFSNTGEIGASDINTLKMLAKFLDQEGTEKLAKDAKDLEKQAQTSFMALMRAKNKESNKLSKMLDRLMSRINGAARDLAASDETPVERQAAGGQIFAEKNDIEFMYAPFSQFLQIGMGGEWWSGKVKPGRNVFHHRKENVDPAYRPVTIHVGRSVGHGMAFDVGGGFGLGAVFVLGVKGIA